MNASVVDLVRNAPLPAAPQPPAAPPKSRFDDVLKARVKPKEDAPKPDDSPKADAPKPEPKKTETKKTDATPADSDAPADTQAADSKDSTDATADSDPPKTQAAAPTQDAKPVKKTDAPAKAVGEAKAKKLDDSDEASDTDAAAATAKAAKRSPVGDSTEDHSDDGDEAEDAKGPAVRKPAKPGEGASEDATPDPQAMAVQVTANQPVAPTPDDQLAKKDDTATDADATAAVSKTAKSPVNTATPTAAPTKAPAPDAPAAEGEKRSTLKPHETKVAATNNDVDIDAQAAAMQLPLDADKPAAKTADANGDDEAAALAAITPDTSHAKSTAPASSLLPTPTDNPPAGPQRNVAEDNVDRIVTSVRGELLTKGGTMQIRLDPPSLGQVQVSINVQDGVLSASLQTTNDEATRLLSHNLAQLKTQLESAGVSVDHIQVKQAAPTEQSNSSQQNGADADARQRGGDAAHDQSARQEQQRREMLQRMWAKLAGSGDPLDLVA